MPFVAEYVSFLAGEGEHYLGLMESCCSFPYLQKRKQTKKSRRENEVVHALSKEQKGRLPAYLVLCGRPQKTLAILRGVGINILLEICRWM